MISLQTNVAKVGYVSGSEAGPGAVARKSVHFLTILCSSKSPSVGCLSSRENETALASPLPFTTISRKIDHGWYFWPSVITTGSVSLDAVSKLKQLSSTYGDRGVGRLRAQPSPRVGDRARAAVRGPSRRLTGGVTAGASLQWRRPTQNIILS